MTKNTVFAGTIDALMYNTKLFFLLVIRAFSSNELTNLCRKIISWSDDDAISKWLFLLAGSLTVPLTKKAPLK